MHEGKELKKFLQERSISATEIAKELDEFSNTIVREFKKEKVRPEIKERLKAIGIIINGKSVHGDFQGKAARYAQYDKKWLTRQIETLVFEGYAKTQKDVALRCGTVDVHLTLMMKGDQGVSKNFVDEFIKQYGPYLKQEIIVGQSRVLLPLNAKAEEIERVIKVLGAYR